VKPAEFRALSAAELANELENAVQRLFTLHFQRTTQNLESTAELRKTRRDIARIRTILAERRRAAAPATPAASETPKPEQPKEAADK